MDTTRNPLNSSQLTRPTYDELLHENVQPKQRVAQLEGQVDALMSQIKMLQGQVAKLTAALDEARRAGKRQRRCEELLTLGHARRRAIAARRAGADRPRICLAARLAWTSTDW